MTPDYSIRGILLDAASLKTYVHHSEVHSCVLDRVTGRVGEREGEAGGEAHPRLVSQDGVVKSKKREIAGRTNDDRHESGTT